MPLPALGVGVVFLHHGHRRQAAGSSSAISAPALDRAEQWTLGGFRENDGLGISFHPSSTRSLSGTRLRADHPTILRQVRELELEIEEADTPSRRFSPVWDTAYAINALVESGFLPITLRHWARPAGS
jgi:hypothetical protein